MATIQNVILQSSLLTVPPEDKEALGVVDEDPVAALTHRELAQVLCARAASGAARVYRAVGDGHLLDVANGKDLGAVLHGEEHRNCGEKEKRER